MTRTSATIKVELTRPGTLPRVYAVQGEKESRQIKFQLYENGDEWKGAVGAAANVRFRRADGTGGSFAGTTVSGNAVYVALSEAVCTKAGPVVMVVELSENGVVLATWPVTVQVFANPGYQTMVEEPEAGAQGKHQAAEPYIIDLSSEVSLREEDPGEYGIDVSRLVDVSAVLAARENGSQIVLKLQKGDEEAESVLVPLDYQGSAEVNQGANHYFGGVTCAFKGSLSLVQFTVNPDPPLDLTAFVWIQSVRTDTVGGDPDGVATTVKLDFTNWDNGSFTETLSDGTVKEHAVVRDEAGSITAIGGIEILGVS